MIIKKEGTRSSSKIREFHRPIIDFKATAYYKMVKVKKDDLSFTVYPGPSHKLGDTDKGPRPIPVKSICSFPPMLDRDTYRDLNVTPFTTTTPCHTQPVERAVQASHRAVKRARTEQNQNSVLLCTNAAIKEGPKRVTKKSYSLDFLASELFYF